MRIGIVVSSNDAEVLWNAFRFGSLALKSGHEVKAFLINKGVELEEIKNEKFNVIEQVNSFVSSKGQILACGTCLKHRNKNGSNACPMSSMKDLLKLVEESDRILSF